MVKSLWTRELGSLASGDRFELRLEAVTGDAVRFRLPEALAASMEPLEAIEGADGRPLPHAVDIDTSTLSLRGAAQLADQATAALWLERQGSGCYRLVRETLPQTLGLRAWKTDGGLEIGFDDGDLALLRPHAGESASLADFELSLAARRLATQAGFDRLLCLPFLRDVEVLEHQVRAVKTVLRRFRGRALLCDEVGLGKTVEAGMVLSELNMRGLIRSVLVIVPPSLIEQWQAEMRRKFSFELTSHDDPGFREHGLEAWQAFDRVIISMHTAKREPHRSAILGRQWDMVVIDEAHHLRNRGTRLWQFASEIKKQLMLLLTATPVQNNLEELFNLVTLLEPGLLSTSRQFQKRFVDRRDKLTPRNLDDLHRLLAEVMVRNRRSTTGLQFTRRWARTERIPLDPAEQVLYDGVGRFVRERWREPERVGPLGRMSLLSLQMAIGSSSPAAAGTLGRLLEHDGLDAGVRSDLEELAAAARGIEASAKAARLLKIAGDFADKMVVFTQFRATQAMLAATLEAAGIEAAVFHGGLTRLEKERAVERFRGTARILLATEAGSEGRNLQFANAVCNFDLPWNPMKIEQRIGRLSRIGQTRDVHVINLVAADTVEAAVLHLLEAKLNMFELVIGEIDMVLGNLDEEKEFHEVIADLWAAAAGADDFLRRMEELGSRLVRARDAYFEQRAHDDRLFADRFTPEG